MPRADEAEDHEAPKKATSVGVPLVRRWEGAHRAVPILKGGRVIRRTPRGRASPGTCCKDWVSPGCPTMSTSATADSDVHGPADERPATHAAWNGSRARPRSAG